MALRLFRPYVKQVIYRYLDCGVLHNGFARIRCDLIVAFLLATIDLLRRASRPRTWVLREAADGSHFVPEETDHAPDTNGIIIYRFGASLYFANANPSNTALLVRYHLLDCTKSTLEHDSYFCADSPVVRACVCLNILSTKYIYVIKFDVFCPLSMSKNNNWLGVRSNYKSHQNL